MKKRGKIFLGITLIFVFVTLFSYLNRNQILTFVEKRKFSQLGYQEEDITTIYKELSVEQRKKLLKLDYFDSIQDILQSENYQSNNLFLYLSYIKENRLSRELISDAILLVNEGIDQSYSEELVSIVKSEFYLSNRLDRYLSYQKIHDVSVEEVIRDVNANIDFPFYTNTVPCDSTKGTSLLINKYYYLDKENFSDDLVVMDPSYDNQNGDQLNRIAYGSFKQLVDDAEREGYHIRNNSAYRSYETQEAIYNNYKNQYGFDEAEKWAARLGYSEHHSGLSLDVGVEKRYAIGKFEYSKEFTWMKENAYKYGFILRYPKEKELLTGVNYEPWHYRYVGLEIATYIYEHDITFEEYYAYFIENEKNH